MNDRIGDSIKERALSLGVGESTRVVCPFCNAQHEKSCSITRYPSSLYFRCFRAACGKAGTVSSLPGGSYRLVDTLAGSSAEMPNSSPRPLTYRTTHLPDYAKEALRSMYELSPGYLEHKGSVCWVPDLESFGFPCHSLDGDVSGFATKRLYKSSGEHKTELFWDRAPPRYYAPNYRFPGAGGAIWVVEDCLSCLKMWSIGCPSIALLGTSMHETVATALLGRFRSVNICLDPDATDKAFGMVRDYKLLFDKMSVVVLKADPKDTPLAELEKLLDG